MRELPKVVGEAPVENLLQLKIWRNKKILTKNVVLGRLEDAAEFKQSIKPKVTEDKSLGSLGINVRNINNNDANNRSKLKKKRGYYN